MSRQICLSVFAALAAASQADAQLRIVQYDLGDVKPDLHTVLEQIGNENVNGIARPLDAIVCEEQASAASIANLASTLNSIYGAGTYVAAPYVGTSTGDGLPGLVYRASSFSLIGSPVGIGTTGTTANARQTIKYQLRPAGYSAAADLYLYASHMQADAGSPNAARRDAEAQSNRADANALGPGKNILYAGNFNLYSPGEAAYTTLTAPGSGSASYGQAVDPLALSTTWAGDSFRAAHTQSPATVAAYAGQAVGGMTDRFDFQLISNQLNDADGLAMIPGSYRAFGNNGTHPLAGAINSPGNTWDNAGLTVPRADVLNALATASDHLPVIVDYQVPAKMSATFSAPLPTRVIQGATLDTNVTVANSANVLTSNGADELKYTVTGSGSISGSANAAALAAHSGNAHALTFNTNTVGVSTGTIAVAATSEAAANPSAAGSFSTTVLAHSNPTFADGSLTKSLDFGIIGEGNNPKGLWIALANLALPNSLTASADFDSVSGTVPGFDNAFSAIQNLPPSSTISFPVFLTTNIVGNFSGTYTIATSDEDIPGATGRANLKLNVTGRVALGGDTDFNGIVDVADLGAFASHWQGHGGWAQGDFDGDGLINISDLGILARNWQRTASLEAALASLGLPDPVPEPTALATLLLSAGMSLRRRRNARGGGRKWLNGNP